MQSWADVVAAGDHGLRLLALLEAGQRFPAPVLGHLRLAAEPDAPGEGLGAADRGPPAQKNINSARSGRR